MYLPRERKGLVENQLFEHGKVSGTERVEEKGSRFWQKFHIMVVCKKGREENLKKQTGGKKKKGGGKKQKKRESRGMPGTCLRAGEFDHCPTEGEKGGPTRFPAPNKIVPFTPFGPRLCRTKLRKGSTF